MWGLGCIVVEMLLGVPLFPGDDEYDMVSVTHYYTSNTTNVSISKIIIYMYVFVCVNVLFFNLYIELK